MSANPVPEPAGRFCARECSDAACEPIDFSALIREGDVIDLASLERRAEEIEPWTEAQRIGEGGRSASEPFVRGAIYEADQAGLIAG